MDTERRALERAAQAGDTSAVDKLARENARAGLAPEKPAFDPSDWLTGYEDLPHDAFYSKDEGSHHDIVQVTDSACGAEGLVLVESRTTSLDRNAREIRQAMECVGLESGFAEERVRHAMSERTESRLEIRTWIRAQLAEALVSYGHCDTDSSVIVWNERPSADPCQSGDKCRDSGVSADKCPECLAHADESDPCECHEEHARAREDRKRQRETWDSWRPEGYAKENGEMHARYEDDAGLREAIEAFGPECGK
jgi:hypothetical protein